MPENKKVSYVFEGTKLKIAVDTNQDGEALVEIILDIKEIPDEIFAAIQSKKTEA